MRRFGKYTWVLVALALLGTAIAGSAAVDATPLTPGETAAAVIGNHGDYAYFSFVPEADGLYDFTSMADKDTYGYLYDANMEQLLYNDDGGSNLNFLVRYFLEAGQQYYYGARYYSSGDTGSFDVLLTRDETTTLFAATDRAGNQSSTVYVDMLEPCTLQVFAYSAVGPITYQWYIEENGDWQEIAGAVGASYSISSVQDPARYRCDVSAGSETQTVSYTVYADNQLEAYAESDEVYVAPNGSATLTTVASCLKGGLTYQWYRLEDESRVIITGAESASYTVQNVNGHAAYCCIVRDEYGNSDDVDFDVYVENDFSVRRVGPHSVPVLSGEDMTLSVRATCAKGGLHFQWYRLEYDEEDYYESYVPISGATGASYRLESIAETGDYECRVEDDYGNSDSVGFYVSISNDFVVLQDYYEIEVGAGESATLSVRAYSDDDALTYQWYDEDDDEIIEGATAATYITPPLTAWHGYYCAVEDSLGESRGVNFFVSIENSLYVEPACETEITVAPDTPVMLSVSASCTAGELNYAWEVYADYEDDWSTLDSTAASVTVTPRYGYQEYRCLVTDQYENSVSMWFEVYVDSELTATADVSTMQRVAPGESATLRVRATALSGSIRYQWYRGGEEIPGATSAEYTTPALSASALYSCRVMDAYSVSETVYFSCLVGESGAVLTPGESRTVQIPRDGMEFFAFTPDATDLYTIESSGSLDTYVHLYDADWNEIRRDDDSGISYNFRLAAQLTAGQTYYYGIRLYSSSESGTLTVRLTRGSGGDSVPEASRTVELALLAGQSFTMPSYDTGDDYMDVEEMISSNPAVVSVSGSDFTVAAAGEAVLTVIYDSEIVDYHVTVSNESVLKLPAGLREIRDEAFQGDARVRFVELGSDVLRIKKFAFRNSGLRQLIVPSYYTALSVAALRGTDPVIVCREGSNAANFAMRYGYNFLYMR